MNLTIGGGVHEHGRNCFYVESDVCYLVDCGIMRGDPSPYPRLPTEKIAETEYLFLTHSHEDHIGAFGWLIGNGFHGTVIASPETLAALPAYEKTFALSRTRRSAEFGNMTVRYGRSGHCTGALWYEIQTSRSKVLFSGDYCENSCFCIDKIENRTAELAILDCAFGDTLYDRGIQEERILGFAKETVKTGPLLLPVPRNGRAADLIFLLDKVGCGISADEKLRSFFTEQENDDYWIPQTVSAGIRKNLSKQSASPRVFLIADAQLATAEGKTAAQSVLGEGGNVLFTGHIDAGSYAERLLKSGNGKLIQYNAHCCKNDADRLAARNDFREALYSHCADL